MATIEVKQLECIRRDNVLFQGVCFNVDDGELLQIDGINGSGKSTMLRIIAGLTEPTEGQVFWNGEAIERCRYRYQQEMTYLGHTNGVKEALTVCENLEVIDALAGNDEKTDFDVVLAQIGLPGMDDALLGKMSAGQKRRVGLTRLIMNRSSIWLLDEPFTSLDTDGKRIVEQLIVEHCRQGGIVIFATHQAMDIEGHEVRHVHLGRTA